MQLYFNETIAMTLYNHVYRDALRHDVGISCDILRWFFSIFTHDSEHVRRRVAMW